jgi:hypothetical protein
LHNQFCLKANLGISPLFHKPAKGRRTAFPFLTLFLVLGGADSIIAQAAPAVSEINGEAGYAGGTMDGSEGNNFNATITLPVSHSFGFQADTLYSRIGAGDFYGGAGHFFWRDPDIGLIGLAGGYLYRSGVDTFQLGPEAQYYIGQFTLGAFAGIGQINYANAEPFIDTNPTRFIGRVSVDYYPIKDLRAGVSYTTAFGDNLGRAELEYQTPIRGLALTAEAAKGDHGYDHLLFGVRYYFGSKKALRDRQRQDDPPGFMQQVLQGLGLYGAEYNQKGNAYLQSQGVSSGGYSSYGESDEMNNFFNPPITAP